MIDISVSESLLVLLRSLLLLGPLFLVLYLGWKSRENNRLLIGALFSFLYSMGLLLPAHALAIHLGFWHYGGNALMLEGMPADLWLAGSLLYGPAIFLAFPQLSPWVFTISCIIVQGFIFQSLDPFVIAGNDWFIGVIFVFLVAHIPALYLAQWTGRNTQLSLRVTLLAFGYGFLAFYVLPTLIMQAMGGAWQFAERSVWSFWLTAAALAPLMIIGLNGAHMFAVHGHGTPIPLDGTTSFVRSGLYAYVRNPMQLCSALSWVVIGVFLQNIFVALAAVMALVFVLGMVRWHHRTDLEVRFHDEWIEYKGFVREWLPRWKPWIKQPSTLICNTDKQILRAYIKLLDRKSIGLRIQYNTDAKIHYIDGNSGIEVSGTEALIYPLFHLNFITAIVGSALLLAVLPWKLFCSITKRHVSET